MCLWREGGGGRVGPLIPPWITPAMYNDGASTIPTGGGRLENEAKRRKFTASVWGTMIWPASKMELWHCHRLHFIFSHILHKHTAQRNSQQGTNKCNVKVVFKELAFSMHTMVLSGLACRPLCQLLFCCGCCCFCFVVFLCWRESLVLAGGTRFALISLRYAHWQRYTCLKRLDLCHAAQGAKKSTVWNGYHAPFCNASRSPDQVSSAQP